MHPYYITGFADGEGSFHVSFRPRDEYLLGWKCTAVFHISQKEKHILSHIQHSLQCGTLRYRKDGVWAYEVSDRHILCTRIVPFFQRYPFLSKKKQRDFSQFQSILEILQRHPSLTLYDLIEILHHRDTIVLDVQGRGTASRTYSREDILRRAWHFWVMHESRILARNRKTHTILRDSTPNETLILRGGGRD